MELVQDSLDQVKKYKMRAQVTDLRRYLTANEEQGANRDEKIYISNAITMYDGSNDMAYRNQLLQRIDAIRQVIQYRLNNPGTEKDVEFLTLCKVPDTTANFTKDGDTLTILKEEYKFHRRYQKMMQMEYNSLAFDYNFYLETSRSVDVLEFLAETKTIIDRYEKQSYKMISDIKAVQEARDQNKCNVEIPEDHDDPVDYKPNDVRRSLPPCGTADLPAKETFETFYDKMIYMGKQMKFNHNAYRRVLYTQLSGEIMTLFQDLEKQKKGFEFTIKGLMAVYGSNATVSKYETELANMQRNPMENLVSFHIRLTILLQKTEIRIRDNEREVHKSREIRFALMRVMSKEALAKVQETITSAREDGEDVDNDTILDIAVRAENNTFSVPATATIVYPEKFQAKPIISSVKKEGRSRSSSPYSRSVSTHSERAKRATSWRDRSQSPRTSESGQSDGEYRSYKDDRKEFPRKSRRENSNSRNKKSISFKKQSKKDNWHNSFRSAHQGQNYESDSDDNNSKIKGKNCVNYRPSGPNINNIKVHAKIYSVTDEESDEEYYNQKN